MTVGLPTPEQRRYIVPELTRTARSTSGRAAASSDIAGSTRKTTTSRCGTSHTESWPTASPPGVAPIGEVATNSAVPVSMTDTVPSRWLVTHSAVPVEASEWIPRPVVIVAVTCADAGSIRATQPAASTPAPFTPTHAASSVATTAPGSPPTSITSDTRRWSMSTRLTELVPWWATQRLFPLIAAKPGGPSSGISAVTVAVAGSTWNARPPPSPSAITHNVSPSATNAG